MASAKPSGCDHANAFIGPLDFLGRHDLIWEVPPARWLEGIPLANGDIGALMWGDGSPLRFTLDKYDAWECREKSFGDETYQDLRRMIEEGRNKEAEELLYVYRIYAEGPHPTRLPMPRFEIDFVRPFIWESGRLRLADATVDITGSMDGDPVRLQALVHANANALLIHLDGAAAKEARLRVGWDHLSDDAKEKLRDWDYPEPVVTAEADSGTWYLETPAGYEVAVAWARTFLDDGRGCLIRLALQSTADAPEPLEAAKRLSRVRTNFDGACGEHRAWWHAYWKRSHLTIPDTRLEALYYAEMYKLGCSSRPGKMPITLQGLWTLDGDLPPWSGEYGLDMNVQQAYWPIYTGNRLELGEPLYRVFSACIPRWREQCRQFFGFDGLWSGCCMGPGGERLFGYSGIELWPGNAAWLAHHYWLHYLYSQDEDFLVDQALPFIELAFLAYANLLESDEDGVLHVPLSTSPEWGEGSVDAFCRDPNCDLALIRFLARAIVQAYQTLGRQGPIGERANEVLDKLTDYMRDDNRLLVSAGTPLSHSHRHHSHLMAIHPLGTLTLDGSEGERDLIRRSLHDIRKKGTGEWTGWSYPWMSLIASRAGLGNMAWQMLDVYANGYITPNTFHINGDPRIFGLSLFEYEPMTLEAGFGAAAAIMEMLIQSYNGCIRLFPSIPDRWHYAHFAGLRAEGAFVVSARLAADEVLFVRVRSEAGKICRLKNPFQGGPAELVRVAPGFEQAVEKPPRLAGEVLEFETETGAEYLVYAEGRRPAANEMEPQPFPAEERFVNFYGKKRFSRF